MWKKWSFFQLDKLYVLGSEVIKYSKSDSITLLHTCPRDKPLELIKRIGSDYDTAWEYLDSIYGDPRFVPNTVNQDIVQFKARACRMGRTATSYIRWKDVTIRWSPCWHEQYIATCFPQWNTRCALMTEKSGERSGKGKKHLLPLKRWWTGWNLKWSEWDYPVNHHPVNAMWNISGLIATNPTRSATEIERARKLTNDIRHCFEDGRIWLKLNRVDF